MNFINNPEKIGMNTSRPNPKEDLKEIEKLLDWKKLGRSRSYVLRKAQEIAERNEFKGGCGDDTEYYNNKSKNIMYKCGECPFGEVYLCPDCQAKKDIQEVYKEIQT